MVDLGGSLAVASTGYWNTGVTTDLNGILFFRIADHHPLERVELNQDSSNGTRESDLDIPTVTYLKAGGKTGDKIKVTAVCEKSKFH